MRGVRTWLVIAGLLACGPLPAAAASEHGKVAWQGWSDDLFRRAAAEHKFVLLHLAAVWCHWCHVMEETTYSDPAVVASIAAHYIPVRVDQDARPDLSLRYEDWGWPATVVFAADGTEIVKLRGYREAGLFDHILTEIVRDPSPIDYGAIPPDEPGGGRRALSDAERERLAGLYRAAYDTAHGAWGTYNKYVDPDAMDYTLALALAGDTDAARRARETFAAARALIDPVWGGVYQYSDAVDWSSPHFEKIMAVQGANLRLYALAFAIWHDPADRTAADAIYRYLTQFLTAPDGAFYTSQDADLGPAVSGHDYFALSDAARRRLGLPPIDTHRYARENGWAISALVAYRDATGEDAALDRAIAAAGWVMRHRRLADGRFAHGEGDADGPFLGDSLAMARAFLDLYRSTGDRAWLAEARRTADAMIAGFTEARTGGLLVVAPRPDRDAAAPPPVKSKDENVAAVRLLALLAHYSGDAAYRVAAERAMGYLVSAAVIGRYDFLPGVLLADRELAEEPVHVTIVGGKGDPAAQTLQRAALAYPAIAIRAEWWDRAEGPLPHADVDYPALPQAAAFACSGHICSLPAFDGAALVAALDRLRRPAPTGG